MVSNAAKFLLLLWKNWKVTIRHPFVLLCEVLIPVVYSLMLIVLRYELPPVEKPPLREQFPNPQDVKVEDIPLLLLEYLMPEDPLSTVLVDLLQLFLLASYLFFCITVAKVVTQEKDLQLKEYMKLMGLHSWLQWAAWFVTFLSIMTVSNILLVLSFKVTVVKDQSVLNYSNPSLIFLFLSLYSVSIIAFSFMISSLSKNASFATRLATFLWFVTYVPFPVTGFVSFEMALFPKLLMCMLPNSAMAFGVSRIVRWEVKKDGLQWSNLFENVDKNMSVGLIFIMMVVDALVCLLVTLYVERIFPGDFGIPLPWYFPFTKSFWLGEKTNPNPHMSTEALPSLFYESRPEHGIVAVELKHLRKVFGDKTAVEDISLNLYKNEITILLGHNGAGKTTTVSMLIGMLNPTSGQILVSGHDIQTETQLVQACMGLCPQHNILFDDLTIQEHNIFYSRIKGAEPGREEGVKVKAKHLSGGAKRVLSVRLAFCGSPDFVVLDEPSSGMDPSSMRELWDFLFSMKENRTILVVTHDMNEANVLADRLAVMSRGRVTCYGTPKFLKLAVPGEYRLKIVAESRIQGKYLMEVVRRYTQEATLERQMGEEFTIVLRESEAPMFSLLFGALEDLKQRSQIQHFSISSTSIEDVFMRAGLDVGSNEDLLEKDERQVVFDMRPSIASEFMRLHRGVNLRKCQTKAMFVKSLGYLRGNYKLVILINVVVVSFVLLAMLRNHDYGLHENDLRGKFNELLARVRDVVGAPKTRRLKRAIIDHDVSFEGQSFPQVFRTTIGLETRLSNMLRLNMSIFTGFAMLFAASSFVMFYVKERSTTFRFIQIVGGLKPYIYWTVAFLVDCLLFSTIILCFFVAIVLSMETYFSTWEELSDILVVLAVFVVSITPLTYLMSYFFEVPSTAFVWVFTIYVFIGIVWQIIYQVLENFQVQSYIAECFILFPPFALIEGFLRVSKQNINRAICWSSCLDSIDSAQCSSSKWTCGQVEACCDSLGFRYRWKGLGQPIVMMVVAGVAAWCLIFLTDYGVFRRLAAIFEDPEENLVKLLRTEGPEESEEVKQEKSRVRALNKTDIEEYQLVAKDLSKLYCQDPALNQLCLAIQKYECFGILGKSGAGKTTAVRILTGDLLKSYGNVWIDGYSLVHERNQVHQRIGYCPQFEGLIDELTSFEHLKIFCLIRGMSSRKIPPTISRLAMEFGFTRHLHKPVCQLSGGTKRKLSTALTLIGNTGIIFLDEPTTGIDPAARKHLWHVTNVVRESQKTIFVTSQMVDECEALCTRMGIMVNGTLVCLGSQKFLKEKYLRGFMLRIKSVGEGISHVARVKNYLQILLHDAELKEEHINSYTYFVPQTFRTFAETFDAIFQAREILSIEDFSLQHTTMEQIFLFFNQ